MTSFQMAPKRITRLRVGALMLSIALTVVILVGTSSADRGRTPSVSGEKIVPVSDTGQAVTKIVGTVSDTAGHPIAMASVYFEGTEVGAATNGSGQYTVVNPPTGRQTLVCSARGMKKITRDLTVTPAEVDTIDLVLEQQ